MNNNISKEVIFNYLAGNSTSIQHKTIEEWMEDPENVELFYEYLNEYESKNLQYSVNIEEKFKSIELGGIELATKSNENKNYSVFRESKVIFRSVAVALIISVLSGIYLMNWEEEVSEVAADNEVDKVEKVNKTLKPITVTLPDNSSIILQPNASLTFSTQDFKDGNREVRFTGQGFFEILKNVESPFIVYTPEFTTKVLGTSFSLKTGNGKEGNEVIVKTGKVAVYKGKNKSNSSIEEQEPTALLSANQSIAFDLSLSHDIQPQNTAQEQLDEPIQSMSFQFEDKLVSEVFTELEKAYHINIVYNKDEVLNCRITAFLSDEPLVEKIRLICFALNASFELNEEEIKIKAQPC